MTISVVVPCFESIPLFYREMNVFRMNGAEYIFINDGSSDGTYPFFESYMLQIALPFFLEISGKEAALYAGLERANGRYVTVTWM